jgi:hypothetical protein
MVLRQGGNKFHGAGWWYGQRSEFDSRDFFNTGEKPAHVRDQYGLAFSGPIFRNKTFFFFDIEKVRQHDPVNLEGYVPTDLMRQGDFSELLALDDPITIFDPDPKKLSCDENGCTRPPFETPNVIDKIDPIGQNIINLYPKPNVDGGFPRPQLPKVLLSNQPYSNMTSSSITRSARTTRSTGAIATITMVHRSHRAGKRRSGRWRDLSHQRAQCWPGIQLGDQATMLFSSQFSLDRVVAQESRTITQPLRVWGSVDSGANGLHRMPTIKPRGAQFIDQCCVTLLAHAFGLIRLPQWAWDDIRSSSVENSAFFQQLLAA